MIDVKKVSTLAMVASLLVATAPCAHAMDEDAEFRAAMALSMQDAPLMDQEDELEKALALSKQNAPLIDQEDELEKALALSKQNTPFVDQGDDLDAALALSLQNTPSVDVNLDDVYAASLQAALDLEAEQLRAVHEASLAEYNPVSEAQKGRPLDAKKDAWGMGDLLRKGLEARPQHMVKDWTNQRAQNTVQMKDRDTSISLEDKQKAADQAKAEAAVKAEEDQKTIQAERARRLAALERAKVETEKQEKAAAEERAAREQARVQVERARRIRELEAKKDPK